MRKYEMDVDGIAPAQHRAMMRRAELLLAAAPQPPEPTPVQMPEPEATVHSKIGTTCMFPSSNMRKGDKIYTEHQVRQKLAAKPTDKGE